MAVRVQRRPRELFYCGTGSSAIKRMVLVDRVVVNAQDKSIETRRQRHDGKLRALRVTCGRRQRASARRHRRRDFASHSALLPASTYVPCRGCSLRRCSLKSLEGPLSRLQVNHSGTPLLYNQAYAVKKPSLIHYVDKHSTLLRQFTHNLP